MRSITCHCEQVFEADLPEIVDLDMNPDLVQKIISGSFLNTICPTCGTELFPELNTRIDWPSHSTHLELIPELERTSFMNGTTKHATDCIPVIGYPELADRVAVLNAHLDPLTVEALKFMLLQHATVDTEDVQPLAIFEGRPEPEILEFHVHGLKKDEVAVSRVPYSLYEKLYDDIRAHPEKEPYIFLKKNSYISIQNIYFEPGE